MGLSVDELQRMNPEQQFNAVAKALEKVSDPTIRAGLAMQVFGKSGLQLRFDLA